MATDEGSKKKQLAQNFVHIKRTLGYVEAEKVVHHKHVDLAFLAEGDVFGKSLMSFNITCVMK